MFKHPALSDKITHPYEVENKDHPVQNLWGQRVTSLIPNGPDLFISTSSKGVDKWLPETFPFLAPEKWKSYGKVYRAAHQQTGELVAFKVMPIDDGGAQRGGAGAVHVGLPRRRDDVRDV